MARRDVPLARARAFRFSPRALWGAAGLSFTARIGRAQFHRARSARKKDGLAVPLSPLFEQPLHPSLNLIQPLAQVGLKHVSFGLDDYALGLDLILKQHQLGKQLLLL